MKEVFHGSGIGYHILESHISQHMEGIRNQRGYIGHLEFRTTRCPGLVPEHGHLREVEQTQEARGLHLLWDGKEGCWGADWNGKTKRENGSTGVGEKRQSRKHKRNRGREA